MMLAGFETPTAGDIRLGGRSLADRPPHKRNMGVVFQNYALFPHMSVAQNLAFPLRVRGVKGRKATDKVAAARTLLKLDGLGDLRPHALSGGQRQRVALARALIFEPDIVLMDEPLVALDRQLREHLQIEIKRIQRALDLTILYVTHDQGEALALSDRVAVFAGGRMQQVGTPGTIYEHPANAFVAGFVGENNRLAGTLVARQGDRCAIQLAGGQIIRATAADPLLPGDKVVAMIRPEHVQPGAVPPACCSTLEIDVDEFAYHGDHRRIAANVPGAGSLIIRVPVDMAAQRGDRMTIGWCIDHCLAFSASEIEPGKTSL